MDCGGQFERDSTVMSQVPLDGVDLCDNLHRPEEEMLAAQTRNLNETNTLAQTSNPHASQNEEKREHRIILNTSFNNNGKDEEEQEVDKEGYTGKGTEDEEDEDTDEVMKEADEEEEESEESSALIHCLSPDTPMTDSSYSETGSLLESPYPFSPGTSPEPTSPIVPASPLGLSQSDTDVDSHISITHPSTVGDSPVDSSTLTLSSDPRPSSPPGLTCISGTADSTAQSSSFTAEHVTSSSQPILCHRPTCTRGPDTHAEPRDSSRISTAVASTTGPPSFTSTDPIPTTGPITSNWEHITSMSVPILSASPLECLEQLAHKGDDTHLPQYLHQIAETFVLHEDYQRALWCVQLERLYHQRILDNLNRLQEQWKSMCRGSSSLEIQHLDSLKHICLTHSRPVAGDAVCAPWDTVRPTFEEGGAKRACISARQIDGGIEQGAEDSSRSQSGHSIIPSINVSDKFKSSEISKKHEEDPSRELRARDGSQLTDMEHSNSETGRAEKDVGHTITVIGNGLHPPTAGGMDQSKPAEQQGGDLGLTWEREAKVEEEETDVEVAVGGLEMKDEGEEEEKDRDAESAQKDPPLETVSGVEMGAQQWHEDSGKTHLNQEAQFSQEANVKQQEEGEEGEEEEEEEDEVYEEEQTDIIREAASLDDMAKLITVEEMSPASGLVSILKKRSACVDNLSTTVISEPQPEKPTAKRRVRFKVPDDGYEQDVGGGDSCLLLFLLCLVTVVISVGGTALYCALGDVQSSVCQDFSRNADFYFGQIQRGITQIHHWFAPGS